MSEPKVRRSSKIKAFTSHSCKGQAFVTCDVNKGMFRGEKIVSFKVMGEEISAIVNENSVKNGNQLEVSVLGASKGMILIGLPGESFSTSRRVWVNKQEISL